MPVGFRFVSFIFVAVSGATIAHADVLSPKGYGPIHFGMRVEAAESTLKQRTKQRHTGEGCEYVEFRKYPNLRFMAEEGILTRADAGRGIRNSARVSVGASLAKVKAMHPKVEVRPHKYDDDGHYLILDAAGARAALVFEESGGKVTAIRAGLKPAVEYVEGCA
ncbi:MAG: hypothetical protein HYX42_10395 [Polaromonas sp.]|uniref:hypothetical protein n=1 Tax=Polaromonas sp. TaxID=1869339 RepID=UPI0025EA4092|nr:hypothetical protein [Polaromonas sp.]MBI2726646.1 hypothetical protein [Polaromonas sp.]